MAENEDERPRGRAFTDDGYNNLARIFDERAFHDFDDDALEAGSITQAASWLSTLALVMKLRSDLWGAEVGDHLWELCVRLRHTKPGENLSELESLFAWKGVSPGG